MGSQSSPFLCATYLLPACHSEAAGQLAVAVAVYANSVHTVSTRVVLLPLRLQVPVGSATKSSCTRQLQLTRTSAKDSPKGSTGPGMESDVYNCRAAAAVPTGAGWFCDKVVVHEAATADTPDARSFYFPSGQWLDRGKSDGLIERTLQPQQPPPASPALALEPSELMDEEPITQQSQFYITFHLLEYLDLIIIIVIAETGC